MCGSGLVGIGRMGKTGLGGVSRVGGWGARTGLEMEAEGVSSCNNKNEWETFSSMSVTAKYSLDLLFYNTCFFW